MRTSTRQKINFFTASLWAMSVGLDIGAQRPWPVTAVHGICYVLFFGLGCL